MLLHLSIRNIVLIESLDLDFGAGLCVLTGETGAGKSILLHALGLTLGMRAESGRVRQGAAQGTVAATFDVSAHASVAAQMEVLGLPLDGPLLILRRTVGSDGKSRAFVNDQPVSVGTLRTLGDALVEIHGQHDQRGLMDSGSHGDILDRFGELETQVAAVAQAYTRWQEKTYMLNEARDSSARAKEEEAYLRHVCEELQALAVQPGEENTLAERRQQMMNREKLAESLARAMAELTDRTPVAEALFSAQRILARSPNAGDDFAHASEALERAAIETEEAIGALRAAGEALTFDARELDRMEERLFALRAAARKHQVTVEELPALCAQTEAKLQAIAHSQSALETLEADVQAARNAYVQAAEALSDARATAARRLEERVRAELGPLKMGQTRFEVMLETLPEPQWGAKGRDRAYFLAATNVGSHAAPLARIASGGELSRFMLAFKVALSEVKATQIMLFDEVDTGIGGAVAGAVGQRLARLAGSAQVLVVTHLPQVAARADHHYHIAKRTRGKATVTEVRPLSGAARKEELARMLAGETITDAARAAAGSLLENA